MMKKVVLGFCAATVLAIAGAKPAREAKPRAPAGADPKLLSAIRKANSDFETATPKADVLAIIEPFAEEAVFLGVDGNATKGRDGIEQNYRDRFARTGPINTRVESEELMLDGDLAYERGGLTLSRKPGDERVTGHARYLTVWQRQSGGDWKIFRHVVLPPP